MYVSIHLDFIMMVKERGEPLRHTWGGIWITTPTNLKGQWQWNWGLCAFTHSIAICPVPATLHWATLTLIMRHELSNTLYDHFLTQSWEMGTTIPLFQSTELRKAERRGFPTSQRAWNQDSRSRALLPHYTVSERAHRNSNDLSIVLLLTVW